MALKNVIHYSILFIYFFFKQNNIFLIYYKILFYLGIVNQGFTRVQIQQGEIKKEFDDMIMHFEQEQAERETQNIELAKKLQVISIRILFFFFY